MSVSLQLVDVGRPDGAASAGLERAPKARRAPPWGLIAGLLAALFIAGLFLLQAGWLRSGPANDFLSFYAAAGAADPYAEVSGRPYARLPFHAALYEPFRALPYPSAYLLFQVLMLWCVAAFAAGWSSRGRALTLAAAALSVPLFFGFMRGQDWPLALAAMAGCIEADRRGRPILAGLCLSLAAIQPIALLAAPLAILAQRRWAMGAGLAGGLAGLGAASFALAGADWPWRFAAAWSAAAPGDPASMPNLAGAAAWLRLDPIVAAAGGLTLAAAIYVWSRHQSLAAGLGAAAGVSLLIAPHARFEDAVLLLPAGLVLAAGNQPLPIRAGALLILSPLFFLPALGPSALPALALLSFVVLLLACARSFRFVEKPPRRRFVELGLG